MNHASAKITSKMVRQENGTWKPETHVFVDPGDGTEREIPSELILSAGFIHDANVGHGVIHVALLGDADLESLGLQVYLVDKQDDEETDDEDEEE